MAFIPAVNVVQTELRFTFAGQQCENVIYWANDAPIDTGVFTGIGDFMNSWWDNYIAANTSTDVTLREIYMTDLTTASSPTYTYTEDLPITGDVSSPALPGNVSWAVQFRTAGRGRSARGRNYIIGLAEGYVTLNTVLEAWADNIVEGYEVLMGGISGLDVVWSVVSRYLDNAPRTTALIQPITAVTYADLYVDSQRRRLTGRGT